MAVWYGVCWDAAEGDEGIHDKGRSVQLWGKTLPRRCTSNLKHVLAWGLQRRKRLSTALAQCPEQTPSLHSLDCLGLC